MIAEADCVAYFASMLVFMTVGESLGDVDGVVADDEFVDHALDLWRLLKKKSAMIV